MQRSISIPSAVQGPTAAQNPPPKLEHHEAAQIRAAIAAAQRIYPGPVGKVLAQYLADWLEWAYRVEQTHLPAQLVHEILTHSPGAARTAAGATVVSKLGGTSRTAVAAGSSCVGNRA